MTLLRVNYILHCIFSGDWIMIYVHFWKQFEDPSAPPPEPLTGSNGTEQQYEGVNAFLAQYNLQNAHWMILASVAVSFLSYYSMGGWLTWYYYIRQKDTVRFISYLSLLFLLQMFLRPIYVCV